MAFLGLINQYRQSNGLATLTLNQNLINAAKWLSQDMATKNYFNHTDSLGRDFSTRLTNFGYVGSYSSENIAAGYQTANNVFVGWQNSPGHNQNMLSGSVHVIGIGRFYSSSSSYGWYWTTDFGS